MIARSKQSKQLQVQDTQDTTMMAPDFMQLPSVSNGFRVRPLIDAQMTEDAEKNEKKMKTEHELKSYYVVRPVTETHSIENYNQE